VKIAVLTGMALTLATASFAVDRYESVLGAGFSDDHVGTFLESLHGRLRTHDLQDVGGPDIDFSFIQEVPNHSYEATVMNTPLRFSSAPASGKATMNRCDATGAILTPGTPVNVFDGAFAARWIATTATYNYIRVTGFAGLGADSGYDIQLRDTTYSIPRWNNSGTQITVLLISNTTSAPVTGSIFFYDAGGALLATQPLSLPPNGLQAVSTASIGPLVGSSGSAQVAHVGGYGALSGKAVSLEPSTGFAFDTAMTPLAH
jgi:hypothetical protein